MKLSSGRILSLIGLKFAQEQMNQNRIKTIKIDQKNKNNYMNLSKQSKQVKMSHDMTKPTK